MYKWSPFTLAGEGPGWVRYISGGGSKQKSRPVKVSMWSPEQETVSKALWPQIEQGLSGTPSYPGQMYVPKTQEEKAYLERTPQLAGDLAGMRARLGQPAYQITPEATEQYYQQSIKAPMMREWEETVEPSIRESYAGPGYWGSARAEAQVEGAENLSTELGRQRGELYYKDELARRSALESAAGREASYGLPYATGEAQMLGSAGEYSRMIDQEKVSADLQRWLMGESVGGVSNAAYSPYMQLAFQFLGLDPYALGTKSEGKSFQGGISY